MGGRVWVESEPGRGSHFRFVARFGLPEGVHAPGPPPSAANLRNLRVLVVDDNRTNRVILEEMLKSWGMQPTSVDGAPAALAALGDAVDRGQPFHLTVTDALMPDTDGFALGKAIREDERFAAVKLIMLTSADLMRGRARAAAGRFDGYLTKPVKQSDLLDSILTAFAPAPPERRAAPARGPRAERGRRLRVLVAEDNATNQRLVTTILAQRGHRVTRATSGRQAVERSAARPFDLILMDVQMPEMDGFEATAAIRHRERIHGGHVPVVAMTAHAMAGDRERCLAAGMDDYVSKPLRAEELFATIDRVCGTAHGKPAPAAPSEPVPSIDDSVEAQALLDSFGHNRKLLCEVIDVFLGDATGMLSVLEHAFARRDTDAIASAAHALKGSVGLFTKGRAFEAASRLEHRARAGDVGNISADVAALRDDVDGLLRSLADVRARLTEM
jgi:CheY-like chemotaxis protein